MTTHPATERPVRLVSASGYALLPASADAAGLSRTPVCRVNDLEANMQAVRADTLVLTQLRRVRVVAGTSACPPRSAYLLVLSEHPDVLARQSDREAGGIILSLIAMPFLGVITGVVALLLAFGSTST